MQYMKQVRRYWKVLLIVLLGTTPQYGQDRSLPIFDQMTDARDGKVYETVEIGPLKWLRGNLRYETALSYCPNFNKKKRACEQGNFYSHLELDTICPAGWRLPSSTDWQNYFDFLRLSKGVDPGGIQIDTLPENYLSLNFSGFSPDSPLFDTSNPILLGPWGWVEGKKVNKIKTNTLWVKKEDSEDNRFHLHIGNSNLILHTHAHNIDDVPKKTRKFMVKCVCEVGE